MRSGIIIGKHYTKKSLIPGIMFMAIILIIIIKVNEPWKWKEQEKFQKDEKMENFRTEKIKEFLPNSDITYALSEHIRHEIDLDELAEIIKKTEPSYMTVWRSKFFGIVSFSGKIEDDEWTVELYFSGYIKTGYVFINIDYSDPYDAVGKSFSSAELNEWARKNYPDVFDEIKEYNRKIFH